MFNFFKQLIKPSLARIFLLMTGILGLSSGYAHGERVSVSFSSAGLNQNWSTIAVVPKEISFTRGPNGETVIASCAIGREHSGAINLGQSYGFGEYIGKAMLPEGEYSGAWITLGSGPDNLALRVSSNPVSGFPVKPGTFVSGDKVVISGGPGNLKFFVRFDLQIRGSIADFSLVNFQFETNAPNFARVVNPTLPLVEVNFADLVVGQYMPNIKVYNTLFERMKDVLFDFSQLRSAVLSPNAMGQPRELAADYLTSYDRLRDYYFAVNGNRLSFEEFSNQSTGKFFKEIAVETYTDHTIVTYPIMFIISDKFNTLFEARTPGVPR